MSSGQAIVVNGLSKQYRLGALGTRPTRATEAIVERVKHPFRRVRYTTFEALTDVSFEMPWGSAVGIVGRNGAGKSTLLKVLSRITAPTTGRIELGGRVGSLLEVGTGFHPELTGKENIYLNGSLLGMRRKEIQRRYDEIVDFSGVERFLATPVKRYSSGMYVRLAFAVAAHLDTEILVIDEVLAVGDAEFQAKSLAKMRDVGKSGRAVVYVSHQLQTVTALCTSAIYLDSGRLAYYGPVDGALEMYRDSFEDFAATQQVAARRPGSGELRASDVRLTDRTYGAVEDKIVEIDVPAGSALLGQYYVSCHINDANGVVVTQCDSRMVGFWLDAGEPQKVMLTVGGLWLKPGRYTVDVFLCKAGAAYTWVMDGWEGAAVFDVLPELPYAGIGTAEAYSRGAVLSDFTYDRWPR